MAELKQSEYEAVSVTNPTSKEFTQNFNGEPYTVGALETKNFARNAAYHFAYKLSQKILEDEFPFSKKKQTEQERNVEATRFSQLTLYDNPKRRMALFRIVKDVLVVQDVIAKTLLSHRGWLEGKHMGTMDEYKKFVEKEGGTFEVKKDEKPTVESLAEEIKELKTKLAEKEKPSKPKSKVE